MQTTLLIFFLLISSTFSLAQQNKQTAYVEFAYNNGNSTNQTIV
jgi:hypothetical protein